MTDWQSWSTRLEHVLLAGQSPHDWHTLISSEVIICCCLLPLTCVTPRCLTVFYPKIGDSNSRKVPSVSTIPTGKDTCVFFCFATWIENSIRIRIREKFWAPSIETHSSRFSLEFLLQLIQIHICENCSWLANSNSIRIHIREKSPGIWNSTRMACDGKGGAISPPRRKLCERPKVPQSLNPRKFKVTKKSFKSDTGGRP